MDKDRHQKLYIMVFDFLKRKIESEEWGVGSQIPTEEELCKLLDVSKTTVRQAVLELVREGYLKRQQGRGTFVCKRVIPEELTMSSSFKELMLDTGLSFTTDVLAQTVMMPVEDLDVKLGVPEDSHIIYIKRLKRVGGEPILLQESYIPYDVCPQILKDDLAANSLIELFEKKYGITITRLKDYFEVVNIKPDDGRILGTPEGSPVLLLEQHFYSGDRQIIYTSTLKKPERFRFSVEFEKRPY